MTHSALCHQTKIHVKEKGLKKQKAKEKKGLKKARDYKKRKISEETETERQTRLEKMKAYRAVKKLTQTEFERKAHLEKRKAKFRQRLSEETEEERNLRLEKQKLYHKKKILGNSNRPIEENTQQHYLNEFDSSKNGELHEQKWAEINMSKFHRSIVYVVSQCTVCHEAWPLKSKPRSPDTYVCSMFKG